MSTYNVTVTYSTTVETEDADHDDEYDVKQAVLDEISSNQDNYLWQIEKVSDAA